MMQIIAAETDNTLSKREGVVELNKRIDLKTLENIGYIIKKLFYQFMENIIKSKNFYFLGSLLLFAWCFIQYF